jgi:TfoX/Sxy family transcriptional regulator of competence genes
MVFRTGGLKAKTPPIAIGSYQQYDHFRLGRYSWLKKFLRLKTLCTALILDKELVIPIKYRLVGLSFFTSRLKKGICMSKSAKPQSSDANCRFELIKLQFSKKPNITLGKMFGSEGLKVADKVFAMCVNGALVVKLPADKVLSMVQAKQAQLFDPGHGRPMKEWLSMNTGSAEDWLALAEQSRKYVAELEACKKK